VKRAFVAAVLLGGAQASAAERWESGIACVGRISVGGGWKSTPNDHFFKQSADAGYATLSRGIGGGQGWASFGYGAISFLEVSIDLFIGQDRFELARPEPPNNPFAVNTLTYGALIGVRFVAMDLFFPGFAPFAGISVGPTLGYVWTGATDETVERLVTGVAGTAGLTYRINDYFGLSLEYRFIYARGVWTTSGINIGGSFFSLGAVIYFPRSVPQSSSMLGGT
jgi:hypothetical protein